VSGDLSQTVARILQMTGFEATRLELEITEGVLTQDPAAALLVLSEIRATGIKIVLDDFGTGYSSLSYFRQFPFDKIKIDRSFIATMLESKRALSIVQAVISLGKGLDLVVVAEGVETEQQLAFLAAQGCTQTQGYLLGRPMPIGHFIGIALEQA
jgi:EAL domain-containing protein (putative c-di-GMP-specific phosphodiesterase class I)